MLLKVEELQDIFAATKNKLACNYIYMLYDETKKFGTVVMAAPDVYVYYPPENLPEEDNERGYIEQCKSFSTGTYFFNEESPVVVINSCDKFFDINDEEEFKAALYHELAHKERPNHDNNKFFVNLKEELIADRNAIRHGYRKGIVSILKKVLRYHIDNKNYKKATIALLSLISANF